MARAKFAITSSRSSTETVTTSLFSFVAMEYLGLIARGNDHAVDFFEGGTATYNGRSKKREKETLITQVGGKFRKI